jgi:aminoglycoside phosphotransferase family enzyme
VLVKIFESGIHLGGVGERVEYALQMRRLPEERMLAAFLRAGQVTS